MSLFLACNVSTASCTIVYAQGTITLRAFAYYDLWLKFKVEGSGIGEHYVDLKWKSGVR